MNENQFIEESNGLFQNTRIEIPLSPKKRVILLNIAEGKGMTLTEFLTKFVTVEIDNYIDELGFNNQDISEMEASIERYFNIKLK